MSDFVDVGNAIRRALVAYIPHPAIRFLAAEAVHDELKALHPPPHLELVRDED